MQAGKAQKLSYEVPPFSHNERKVPEFFCNAQYLLSADFGSFALPIPLQQVYEHCYFLVSDRNYHGVGVNRVSWHIYGHIPIRTFLGR